MKPNRRKLELRRWTIADLSRVSGGQVVPTELCTEMCEDPDNPPRETGTGVTTRAQSRQACAA